MSRYLPSIHSPEDLKKIPDAAIPELASEIRSFLIDTVTKRGGHLASNLGVVELTLAIHRVFSSPKDHVIFDVGHQAYVHKILTGRADRFDTLRIPGGLSGFTSRRESEHDPFGAGHSSTSISAALGFAEADKLAGRDSTTVCVIGDGAYTGGMVHEALNNCKPDLKMVIVLNENRMSISKNKGAFASYLSKVRISEGYRKMKNRTKTFLEKIPNIGPRLEDSISEVKRKVLRVLYRSNYFEDLGLYYIGPVNGNDFIAVQSALKRAKDCGGTVVVHVKTKKGKGYKNAEDAPDKFHAVHNGLPKETFHNICAQTLTEMAGEEDSVVAVTAAMGLGTGLNTFGEKFPTRYFDVGIAEEHALTFSAGLAASGLKPYVAIYSTFLQRGFDNIVHDIALQNLPVHLLIDRAGLAVSDGATHHGIFDVPFLLSIPNMSLFEPATFDSMKEIMHETAVSNSPVAIRYPNAGENDAVKRAFFDNGKKRDFGIYTDFDGEIPEVLFVTYGAQAARTLDAEKILTEEGIRAGTVLIEVLKPLHAAESFLRTVVPHTKLCVFAEESIRIGGVGMTLSALLADEKQPPMSVVGVDDNFAVPESVCDLFDFCGLTGEKLAQTVRNLRSKTEK